MMSDGNSLPEKSGMNRPLAVQMRAARRVPILGLSNPGSRHFSLCRSAAASLKFPVIERFLWLLESGTLRAILLNRRQPGPAGPAQAARITGPHKLQNPERQGSGAVSRTVD